MPKVKYCFGGHRPCAGTAFVYLCMYILRKHPLESNALDKQCFADFRNFIVSCFLGKFVLRVLCLFQQFENRQATWCRLGDNFENSHVVYFRVCAAILLLYCSHKKNVKKFSRYKNDFAQYAQLLKKKKLWNIYNMKFAVCFLLATTSISELSTTRYYNIICQMSMEF